MDCPLCGAELTNATDDGGCVCLKCGYRKPAASKMMHEGHRPRIAIIGGTGIYNPDTFELIEQVRPDTPYGKPSSAITRSPGAKSSWRDPTAQADITNSHPNCFKAQMLAL